MAYKDPKYTAPAAYFPTDNYITLWPLSAITHTGVTMTYSLYVQGKKV